MLQLVQQLRKMYHADALALARARQINKEDYVKQLNLNK